MRIELAASPQDAARLAHKLEEVNGVSRIALAREVLRAPELLTVSPTVAIDVQLAMLAAFAQLRSVSLWTLDKAKQVSCVRHVGEGGPSRGAKQLAQRLLSGESAEPIYAFRREEKPEITAELFLYCLNEFWDDHHSKDQTLDFREVAHGRGGPAAPGEQYAFTSGRGERL